VLAFAPPAFVRAVFALCLDFSGDDLLVPLAQA
jgi:hypothetical protein